MKATIRDSNVLKSLAPIAVATYLRSKNWRQIEMLGDKGSVWTLHSDGGQQFEILLPLNRELRDYASRMSDLLSTLEVIEGRESDEPRSQLDILTDITNATSDLLRIRLQSARLESGTLLIEQGVRVIEHARDLLLAAACATVQPRPLYQTKKATQAVDYLKQVRIGQPERGSFVLVIQSEVPPRLASRDQPALVEIEEPFERQVMLTLAAAVTAARNAAQHAGATGNWQPFTQAVHLGVSANLCDAIAGLVEDGGADSVAMSFSWAPGRALLRQAPERILLAPDMIPVLREGARIFRGTAPLEDFELRGMVVKLERTDGSPSGTVTVAGVVDGHLRKVLLELPSLEYELAIEAHRVEQPVYCEGELAREGRSYVLRNPRGFRIEVEVDTIAQ